MLGAAYFIVYCRAQIAAHEKARMFFNPPSDVTYVSRRRAASSAVTSTVAVAGRRRGDFTIFLLFFPFIIYSFLMLCRGTRLYLFSTFFFLSRSRLAWSLRIRGEHFKTNLKMKPTPVPNTARDTFRRRPDNEQSRGILERTSERVSR